MLPFRRKYVLLVFLPVSVASCIFIFTECLDLVVLISSASRFIVPSYGILTPRQAVPYVIRVSNTETATLRLN
jgi:hypothetical protein